MQGSHDELVIVIERSFAKKRGIIVFRRYSHIDRQLREARVASLV